jgi:hypothetical protein
MHTAQLSPADFATEVDGTPVDFDEIFRGWHQYDRFGIVVHDELGATGASLLVQAAITAFFSFDSGRRDERPQYPEVYLFHVGRGLGECMMLDFVPSRKEVIVDADPTALIEAINDRAITRLAVPQGKPRILDLPHQYGWSERQSAEDRIASAYAYSPTGRVDDADLVLSATSTRTEDNCARTVNVESLLADIERQTDEEITALAATLPPYSRFPHVRPYCLEDHLATVATSRQRLAEVPDATRTAIWEARKALRNNGLAVETYRRITPTEALRLLMPS